MNGEVSSNSGLNWFERSIMALSPRTAYKRMAYRFGIDEARSYYDSADFGRLNQGWRAVNQSAELESRYERGTIRARARDLERNSDIANGMINALVRNVVGSGLKLQAQTKDDELNKRVESLFARWQEARNCDLLQTQTLDEMCRMIIRRQYVDGGILIVKNYVPGRIVPFCIQLIEVDELDAMRMKPRRKTNTIRDGIEYDRFGKRFGYWLRKYDAEGLQPLDSVFYPADDVIFYMHADRPSQRREVSRMAATLSRIRDMNQFMEAVSVKERIAACLSVFIKRTVPGPGGAGRGRKLFDGQSGYAGKTLTPGMIQEMQPGDEMQVVQPPNQGGGATDFVRLQHRLASSGQGMSYEATSRDLSQVTYSSARQGMIEDESTYNIERKSLIDHVLSEIYREFLLSAYLSGVLKLPGFDGESIAPFTAHSWIAPARKWIDPYKEARADEVAQAMGNKTFSQLCAEHGLDWREQLDQLALEKKTRVALGLAEGVENQ